jgi:hypothetical protein
LLLALWSGDEKDRNIEIDIETERQRDRETETGREKYGEKGEREKEIIIYFTLRFWVTEIRLVLAVQVDNDGSKL